jgi:hypothetical protein
MTILVALVVLIVEHLRSHVLMALDIEFSISNVWVVVSSSTTDSIHYYLHFTCRSIILAASDSESY